jgi:hypothetical protein
MPAGSLPRHPRDPADTYLRDHLPLIARALGRVRTVATFASSMPVAIVTMAPDALGIRQRLPMSTHMDATGSR